jgi:two-component system nitrogen regulation sensor histidine kinase NtrY
LTRPAEPAAPSPGPRVRFDRLILFGVLILLLIFLGGYQFVRKTAGYSWPYLTNSVLLNALLVTNAILVLTLVTLLMRNLVKALVERRRGILGSRFRTKLVFSLLLLWLVPSGIIFYAALHLIQRSIDRWFNDPVDRLTEASQEIVSAYYEEAEQRGAALAREAATRLGQGDLLRPESRAALRRTLGELLRDLHLDLVSVDFGQGPPFVVLDPRVPATGELQEIPPDTLRAAFAGQPFRWMSELRGGHLIRCGHPVRTGPEGPVGAVVTVGVYVRRDLARLAKSVTQSNEDYRQIRAQKGLIKRVYVLVFALITLVVLFSVTWIGLYLARRITEPIQSLLEGTRAISSGHLEHRVQVQAGDELGLLVDSFNQMTAELQAGRATIESRNLELSESNRQLMERRRYIETLLENLTTGVVSLDREGRVTTLNRDARRLLGLPGEDLTAGRSLARLLAPETRGIIEPLVGEVLAQGRPTLREVTLSGAGGPSTLAAGATPLRDDGGSLLGVLLVLEDLTDLMRAQKIAAWREVARRLAHEIKNPLTPIRLSAERIRKKYSERSGDLDAIVEEGTSAIVREVGGLKNLVDEFTRFARLPAPHPVPTDLKGVLDAALALYNGMHGHVAIEAALRAPLPPVMIDPEQLKRVLINLLDNAVEAMGGRGRITVGAGRDPVSGMVQVTVADEGPGIRPEDRERLFVPYFSTKKSGTGLGLAIVHRIVTDHMGRIRVEDNLPRGARFVIDLPAAAA